MKTKNLYITTRISEKMKKKIEAICEEEITLSEFLRLAIQEKINVLSVSRSILR